MGWVKLNFRPLYFLHGTPGEASLGRAASHGCVRMANRDAIELARLVHRHASPELRDADLDRLERNPTRSQRIMLQRPVPLAIVYVDVEIRGGQLLVHPNVYARFRGGLDYRILEALARAGYSSAEVSTSTLSMLVERSANVPLSVPLESVSNGTVERMERKAGG